jgi:hypothetical protein
LRSLPAAGMIGKALAWHCPCHILVELQGRHTFLSISMAFCLPGEMVGWAGR